MTGSGARMAGPLGRKPLVFRCWWIGCVVALLVSFAAVQLWAPGPDLETIAKQPGAFILFALILLADLYPTLPWMRNSNPFDEYILSTPLAIAALLVFGPNAAVVFVVAGAAMTLAVRMVWWRVVLNTALWGLSGAAAAGALALITGPYAWDAPMPSTEMLPDTVVLAVVVELVNVVLVTTSLSLARASTWRESLVDWRRQIAVAALALTAPIPAILAQNQPALLPLLALAMVAAQSGMSAVASRTALAGTDPLTSVANRAGLLARLTDRLDQPGSQGGVTLLLVDLDSFKEINDRHGHLTGDRVLVEVARRLEESTRSDDLVARFGGDEFAIVLSGGVPQRTVQEVSDRIRGAVAKPIVLQERTVAVGVSIGAATARDRGFDAVQLIERADAELYRAKAARPARAHGSALRPAPVGDSPGPPVAAMQAERGRQTVAGESMAGESVQRGSVQRGSVQRGSVQRGSVQRGSVQPGSRAGDSPVWSVTNSERSWPPPAPPGTLPAWMGSGR